MPSETDLLLKPRRILMIERDFAIVRHVTRALAPHPVTSARTLDQAQLFLDRQPFDVLVFDPDDLDGLDFLLWLARERPGVRRVIYSRNPEVERAFGLAHATMHKPADDHELRTAVLSKSDSSEFRPIRS